MHIGTDRWIPFTSRLAMVAAVAAALCGPLSVMAQSGSVGAVEELRNS